MTGATDGGLTSASQPQANPVRMFLRNAREEIRHSNKWAYLFIAPLLFDFALFTVYMIYRVITMSFQTINYGTTRWVGSETL